MAKPMPVASTHAIGPSSFIPATSTYRTTAKSTKQRRRRRTGPSSSPLAPSSTLLSLLAAVASSSVAEGSPAPPAFLCPSIESTPIPTHTKNRRSVTTSAAVQATTGIRQTRAVVQNIAHKYEQGEDGKYRRVELYTLYGICPNCAPALDGQISRNNITMPNNNISKHEPPDNLPPGWSPVPKLYNSSHTTLILAMSLVLAFFICFLIIGCLFWRKSMRRKYKEDLEKKGRRRLRRNESASLSAEEIREIENDRENKAKQKFWARATARWKANVRQAARQRRGRRLASSIRGRQSTTSLDNPRDHLTSGDSSPSRTPPRSRSPSRRSSSASFYQEPTISNSSSSSPTENAPIPTIALSAPEPPASPPAYQQKSDHSQQGESPEGLFVLDNRTSTPSLSRRPSRSSTVVLVTDGDSREPSSPALAAAHVATDDKTVLARLAELASAPPTAESTSEVQISVPEWRDEQLEDFIALEGSSDDQGTRALSSPPSPFPAPPSKVQLLAPNFYDYPYSFEDMSSEPEYGPSAPPFEETPSAPMVDENTMALLPSAPPLIDDDDFYMPDSIPSAPLTEHTSTLQGRDDGQTLSQPQSPPAEGDGVTTPSARSLPEDDLDESHGVLPVYRP